MVSALQPLTCDECHEGFVVIIENKTTPTVGDPLTEASVDEEKQRANE